VVAVEMPRERLGVLTRRKEANDYNRNWKMAFGRADLAKSACPGVFPVPMLMIVT
jgi:hypothetical protein